MQGNKDLNEYRNQIDSIDEQIIKLIHQRYKIVEKIWIYKKQNNIPILQKWRWEDLLKKNIKIWKQLWLSKYLIEDIWNRIHIESLKIEK